MDPDLFITIAFCSLVFGFAVGVALIVRSALRGDADPDERAPNLRHSSHPTRARRSTFVSIRETPDVNRSGNPSPNQTRRWCQWHP